MSIYLIIYAAYILLGFILFITGVPIISKKAQEEIINHKPKTFAGLIGTSLGNIVGFIVILHLWLLSLIILIFTKLSK